MQTNSLSAVSAARKLDFSSATLHILAMLLMLLDHLWATIVPGQEWLTCLGRVAFPIFAFLAAEGYFHTHNFKRYCLRLLLFALISEVPFNLMYGGQPLYPFHQNVLWTFLIALLGMRLLDLARSKMKLWLFVPTAALLVLLFTGIGQLAMVDYFGAGVLTVFVFYFFHGRNWWCFVGQLIGLGFIHIHLLGSMYYPIIVFGHEFHLVQQGLALLALLPIWLYHGRQGHHSKPFQYLCYAFYPVHILILVLLSMLH